MENVFSHNIDKINRKQVRASLVFRLLKSEDISTYDDITPLDGIIEISDLYPSPKVKCRWQKQKS